MSPKHLFAIALCLAIAAFIAVPAHQAAAAPASQHPGVVHVVQYGETLFAIGRAYGVSPWAIAQANGLINPNYIRAGQILVIPRAPKPSYGPPHHGPGGPGCYVVMPGDTLFRIGARFGVSPWAIARANGLCNPNYIRAGQCLVIPRW